MTTEQIFERVRDMLSEQLRIDAKDIKMEDNFIDDMNADSLDIVEMVMSYSG